MSEFQSDIKDREYDEEGNELDRHGFKIQIYPNGLESVRKSVENCETMCGLDKRVMEDLLKGKWSEVTTLDSTGRSSKKIVIEYDVQYKKEDGNA
tara:strand:- start:1238 stop:1522 length:285 start_codon:yes stop_codon:yes gene_type:complete